MGLLLVTCKGRWVEKAVQLAHCFAFLVSDNSVVRCTATPLQGDVFEASKKLKQADQSGWLSTKT